MHQMAERQAKSTTFNEIERSSGRITKAYVLNITPAQSNLSKARLDQVPVPKHSHPRNHSQPGSVPNSIYTFFASYQTWVLSYLKTLFLPIGYPSSVTPDYTPYQIYDSLQAFCSSIAGLLSSRAVLQSLNVVSSTGSAEGGNGALPAGSASAATAATVLSIFQATLSNLTTILFASHAAPRISSEVKFYRFLADVVNDAAFVLDLLAPSLPSSFGAMIPGTVSVTVGAFIAQISGPLSLSRLSVLTAFFPSPRVVALCTSSMLRAVCGVAGGSSKAVLSAHFARNNPESVGDLNAKDSSQETVIGLLGMWVGGVVVSRVQGMHATWAWMLGLLAVHLWTNWCAVTSVRLTTLNRERAGLVMERLVWTQKCSLVDISVHTIGARENVLGIRNNCQRRWSQLHGVNDGGWRSWQVGASIKDFFAAVYGSKKQNWISRGSFQHAASADMIEKLTNCFADDKYLLWVSEENKNITIVLKKDARPVDQLRAWHHAFELRSMNETQRKHLDSSVPLACIISSHATASRNWPHRLDMLERAGWDVASSSLDDGRGIRVEIT